MPRIRFLAAAALTVGLTTTVDLEAPRGVSESSLRAALSGDLMPVTDARLDRGLKFETLTVDIQRPTLAAAGLDAWFRRDMSRGWQALGGIGPVRADGTRSAWFSRRHAAMRIDWPVYGVAKPAPCRDAEAVACFEASTRSGDVRLEFGGQSRFVRVRPFAHLSVYERAGELVGEVRFLGLVRHGDAARLAAIDNGRKWSQIFGFLEQAVLRPDVDHDGDGIGDHWRVSGAATGRIRLL